MADVALRPFGLLGGLDQVSWRQVMVSRLEDDIHGAGDRPGSGARKKRRARMAGMRQNSEPFEARTEGHGSEGLES